MRTAIYARKSTDQSGVTDEHRSVSRQIEHARAFARSKGWHVLDEHIYVDDGVSGAEFARRHGFIRMMNALPHRSFDAIVMSEESRLGREAIETAYALKQIVSAGVRVFFYLDGAERTLGSPTDKLLMSVTAFADELERERARQRTHDALSRKAKAGHVTGGRVFGYDNVDVLDASGNRTHVERRVNEAQAAVVRRIFELAATGVGMRRIALMLNEDCAPAPRAQRGRPSAWCPSSVHEALRRDLYRGVITWNKSRKRDAWGRKDQQPRTSDAWIEVPAEHLRIVSPALWDAVHLALSKRRAAYARTTGGATHGRPVASKPSRYMLTGLVECGVCHGPLVVRTNSRKGQPRVAGLGCWNYHTRGRTVCGNKTEAPLTMVTDAIFDRIAAHLFHPSVVDLAVTLAVEALRAVASDSAIEDHEASLAQLDLESSRLAQLTAAGVGDLPGVIARLKAIRTQRERLIRASERTRVAHTASDDIAATVRDRMNRIKDVLNRRAPEAKQVLEGLLTGRIVVTPLESRGMFNVAVPLSALTILDGFVAPKALASPTGFERLRCDLSFDISRAA